MKFILKTFVTKFLINTINFVDPGEMTFPKALASLLKHPCNIQRPLLCSEGLAASFWPLVILSSRVAAANPALCIYLESIRSKECCPLAIRSSLFKILDVRLGMFLNVIYIQLRLTV